MQHVDDLEKGFEFDLKSIIEGALFASGKPLSLKQLQALFGEMPPSTDLLEQILAELTEDYRERGIQLQQVASGYRFQVSQSIAGWVGRLWEEKPVRYSRAILETLVLIAYRQPITRGEIEDVRGVAVSSHIIKTLLEREWVRVVGHKEVPGRPAMYATTREFLDYFNLSNLEDLPSLPEIQGILDGERPLASDARAAADTESVDGSNSSQGEIEEPKQQTLGTLPQGSGSPEVAQEESTAEDQAVEDQAAAEQQVAIEQGVTDQGDTEQAGADQDELTAEQAVTADEDAIDGPVDALQDDQSGIDTDQISVSIEPADDIQEVDGLDTVEPNSKSLFEPSIEEDLVGKDN